MIGWSALWVTLRTSRLVWVMMAGLAAIWPWGHRDPTTQFLREAKPFRYNPFQSFRRSKRP